MSKSIIIYSNNIFVNNCCLRKFNLFKSSKLKILFIDDKILVRSGF